MGQSKSYQEKKRFKIDKSKEALILKNNKEIDRIFIIDWSKAKVLTFKKSS